MNDDYGKIFKKYEKRIASFLHTYFPEISYEDIEDLVIQTFHEAIESEHQFQDGRARISWLFGIAKSNALDYVKKSSDKNETPLSELTGFRYINAYNKFFGELPYEEIED